MINAIGAAAEEWMRQRDVNDAPKTFLGPSISGLHKIGKDPCENCMLRHEAA